MFNGNTIPKLITAYAREEMLIVNNAYLQPGLFLHLDSQERLLWKIIFSKNKVILHCDMKRAFSANHSVASGLVNSKKD